MLLIFFLIFGYWSAARALPQQSQGIPTKDSSSDHTELSKQQGLDDRTSNGLYQIINCGTNAPRMIDAFNSLHGTLQLAVQDAMLSSMRSSTSPAYTAFFKDGSRAPYVRSIISNALTGVAVPPGVPGKPAMSPKAVCVSSPDQLQISQGGELFDMHVECLKTPSVRTYIITGSSLIVICPSFFEVPMTPTPGQSNCVAVSGFLNRFIGAGTQLIDYQIYVLLHEIARYYIYAANQDKVDHYDINTCFKLGPLESSQNAQNYAYYVASKSSPVFQRFHQTLVAFGRSF